ncbi:hypothetical protein EPN15_04280 [Patescibacteria group bacterium]|nr:MAG: hypothetical protein EPN15_04280 [Patescibacteria group bacterium]
MTPDRRKILVTHIYPHLDEICAFWLFKRFGGPDYTNAVYRFMPISEDRKKTFGGQPVDSDPDIIHVGIAGGRFDEHVRDGGKRISSASLVWDFLKIQKHYPKDKLVRRAIEMMVDYVAGEDNGETHVSPRSSFRLQSILYGAWLNKTNHIQEVTSFGMKMLDHIFTRLIQDAQFEIDWKKRIEFKTRWGKAVALATETSDTDGLIYSKGCCLALTLDPKYNYRMYRASPISKVDLTKTYKHLSTIDPKPCWYIHQSKKLVICGGALAPKVALSKLTLKEMIKAIH